MRILFLSDNFPPESNAPATRLFEHATRWIKAGHEVTVITCAPNFPEGRLFDGYRNRLYQVETMDGIRVVRVKTYITANEGFSKRILDYLSFMVSGFLAGIFQRKADIVIGTSPQFFCAVGAWALAAVRRKPFVFELRDLWPAAIIAVDAMKEGAAIRMLEKLELFLYRRARTVIPVTEAFKKDLTRRGIDPAKIHVVRNGVDLERYHPMDPDPALAKEFGLEGKFVVGYLGTHGLSHGLDKVLEAVDLLKKDERIVFLFVGAGAARGQLETDAAERGLTNVRLVPRQPKSMMPRLWSLCDVSLIPLRDEAVFSTVIPSKLFESLGMGVPVIMAMPEGEATGIVRETGTGRIVPPERPEDLAAAVDALSTDRRQVSALREACLEAARHFSRESQAKAMLEILQNAIK